MCPVCPDHKIVFWSLMLKVGLKFAELYASLYALYVANKDPGIAITLTFIHNTVRIQAAVFHFYLILNFNSYFLYTQVFSALCIQVIWLIHTEKTSLSAVSINSCGSSKGV